MRIAWKTMGSVAVLAVLTAGCGLVDRGETPESDGEAGEAAAEDGEAPQGEDGGGTTPDAEAELGETSVPYGSGDGEITAVVNGLTERGELLQLDYTLTFAPGDPSQSDPESLRSLFDAGHGENMYLVDTANLRRHTVVEDDGGSSLEPDPWDTELAPEVATTLSATFASTEDMESADVYLYGFPPIMDVPVAKEGS